ncbi:MAG: glycoside hydrolase family 3 N-terminal domain-containing protein, partial [Anaerolineales bacterium]|nr:glycoside hydrolase family 3 N-terminal domain-containing protein [Anaerolineales bacterium]
MLTGKISRMGKRYCAITLCLFIFAMLLEVPKGYAAIPLSSEPDTDSRVAQIMRALSPEQRVGQLFVVTFDGSTISPESAVYSLVGRYGIGGVMLAAEHDNFDDREDVLLSTRNLVTDLQQLAWQASQTRADDGAINTETTSEEGVYLPLLVGLTHQGGGPSYSALHSGLTSAPSAMAIGATWDVSEAGRIGEIAGFELNALGINLQLGPMLDVMEYPRAGNPGDPGVRSFGGSGYWVGEFAREYVAGVHRGSQGRIALVGQSFPGLGSGDRETVFDIPTVNKSLKDLLTVDLWPFFAVTASSPGDDAAIDVLMPAQGRYSAWQGALSSDTRPLGMDGAALGEVLRDGQLTDWRQQGGVIMSAPLGWRGVRRYYDPTGNTFPAFEIARDALLAGNDVLFVDQFAVDSSEGQYQTVVDTMDGFVRKYREDAAFAERVDGAVESIIALKLRLYGNDVSVDNVIGDVGLRDIGASEGDVFSLARQSVTLLSPHLSELANRLPRPPSRLERIVIFTDSSVGRQCSACPKVSYPAVDALENAIGRLYGFVGSRQISGLDVFSFSFAELERYLDGVDLLETPSAPPASTAESVDATPAETAVPELTIRDALPSARWLVFALGDVPAENAEANALRRFLAEKPELLTDRNVIVLALSAPYYLDATEVAQLTAYYGLYGHSSAFIEVAARVLFQEIVPHHAPPVSVKSVSYDLIGQLAADPGQSFSLSGIIPSEEAVIEGQSPAPDIGTEDSGADLTGATPWAAEAASEGSAILLNTSVLMDKNGHVIPDGTVVEFEASYLAEGGLTETFAASGSVQGVASATLVLERVGLVEISARAGDAQSAALVIDVRMNEG